MGYIPDLQPKPVQSAKPFDLESFAKSTRQSKSGRKERIQEIIRECEINGTDYHDSDEYKQIKADNDRYWKEEQYKKMQLGNTTKGNLERAFYCSSCMNRGFTYGLRNGIELVTFRCHCIRPKEPAEEEPQTKQGNKRGK